VLCELPIRQPACFLLRRGINPLQNRGRKKSLFQVHGVSFAKQASVTLSYFNVYSRIQEAFAKVWLSFDLLDLRTSLTPS